jgi:hypothetical protein
VTNPAAGFSLAFNQYGTVAITPFVPADQRLEGPQGLTFRSRVLDRPIELVGPSALRLVASSTANNTDWHAKLADVAPDGSETIITEGSLRASHRAVDSARSRPARPYHPHTNPQPIVPGRFYAYDVEIWPTAYRLASGHRLQLRLTSTDLPTHLPGAIRFDRDSPQSTQIALLPPARNTVRLGESHLTVSVAGAASGDSAVGTCAPRPRASISRNGLRASRRRGITLSGRAIAFRCASGERRRGRVTRVRVAVARVSGRRCRFAGPRGRLGPRRSCSRPRYLPARLGRRRDGKVPWTFRLRHRLPRGRYVAHVRARDDAGRASPPGSRLSRKRFAIR